ncbi:MAG TPA: outer membrane beta-barrel protein [Candidatus Acidoferrales bacterium]|nr:outer membrane beta-barrel protein [Candidatus Acidoferrales bacterium]
MAKWSGCVCAIALLAAGAQGQTDRQALKLGHSIELSGGYSFSQFRLAGTETNMSGAIGAIGFNLTPWLQLRADASVAYGNDNGTPIRIYANHFGPRIYFRRRNAFGASPFGEVLVGGSRLDFKTGGPGYATADNGFSLKAGGGVDFDISSRFAVRAIDMDYYMTPFFSERQNNLWVSTGFVVRFGGGRP